MEGRWQPAPFGFVAQYMDEGRPLPEAMTDAVHEAKLFADGTKQGYRRRIEPDWASIHRELKRKHVTLSILWDEYVVRLPDFAIGRLRIVTRY